MEFYKIVLKSIPELSMAHSYETSSYNIAFKKQENKLEISYIEMGDVEKTHEDGRVSLYKAPFVGMREALRKDIIDEAVDAVRPTLCQEDGTWIVDYVRIRIRAVKA